MYNKIILSGNLTRDIEIKYTPGGSAIGNTAIATSRKFKAQDGTQKEELMFVDITFFGRTAEISNQYLRKGSKVLVDGRLKLDSWAAPDGTKRSKHSVIVESLQMLGSKDEAKPMEQLEQGQSGYGDQVPPPPPPPHNAPLQTNPEPMPDIDINEEEIPFN